MPKGLIIDVLAGPSRDEEEADMEDEDMPTTKRDPEALLSEIETAVARLRTMLASG